VPPHRDQPLHPHLRQPLHPHPTQPLQLHQEQLLFQPLQELLVFQPHPEELLVFQPHLEELLVFQPHLEVLLVSQPHPVVLLVFQPHPVVPLLFQPHQVALLVFQPHLEVPHLPESLPHQEELLPLNPPPHQLLSPHLLQELHPDLEPSPRPPLPFAETESQKLENNAKEDFAVLTNADSFAEEEFAEEDLQELPRLASPNNDAMPSVFALPLRSSKTPRENARKPTELEVSATSPLVPAYKKIKSNLFRRSKSHNQIIPYFQSSL
jgi:hypothetical protein